MAPNGIICILHKQNNSFTLWYLFPLIFHLHGGFVIYSSDFFILFASLFNLYMNTIYDGSLTHPALCVHGK